MKASYMTVIKQYFAVLLFVLGFGISAAATADAADLGKIRAFLNVTGFDVALDSIALSAGDAPQMLGMEPGAFGHDWKRISEEVFDTDLMNGMALDLLSGTLDEALLDHAAAFYATPLGMRLVQAENQVHMNDDSATKQADGREIVSDLVATGSKRIAYLRRMGDAIDSSGSSVRALQEIQLRFLLAASDAGVIRLKLDEKTLRDVMKQNEAELRTQMALNSLASSAHAYRDFSDEEVLQYTQALENDDMRQVYELMNAIQYEIMANRFEVLARRMADLHPGQEL